MAKQQWKFIESLPNNVPLTALSTSNVVTSLFKLNGSNQLEFYFTPVLPSDPTLALQAATKQYVDNKITTTINEKFYSGIVAAASFTGNPKKYSVVFTTPFPNANYSISIIGGDGRVWSYESVTLAGFTINSNANAALTQPVRWEAELN